MMTFHPRTHCIKCGNKFRLVSPDGPQEPGDIYSSAGEREAQISGYCEYDFDVFGDDDDAMEEHILLHLSKGELP